MARAAHAAQIDLGFGDPACKNLDVSAGVRPSNLTCKRLHLVAQHLVILDGHAQAVAQCVFSGTSAAEKSFWPGANPSIRAVGSDLADARQAASFPSAGVVSIT